MIRALLLSILLVLPFAAVSQAREDGGVITAPSGTIPVGDNAASDAAIRTRIDSILSQVSAFDKVRARVDAGIVRLTGEVTEQVQIDRLNALMARVDGVVAIQNDVILTTDIGLRLGTVRDRFLQRLNQVIAGLPFVALGLVVGALILLVGSLLFGRPDIGLILVAWWTGLSLLVHFWQVITAELQQARGEPVTSWLEG